MYCDVVNVEPRFPSDNNLESTLNCVVVVVNIFSLLFFTFFLIFTF